MKQPESIYSIVSKISTEVLIPSIANDPWGRQRPTFSADAMRLSFAMAYSTYGMQTEPWTDAGWRDISIQIDRNLVSGINAEQADVRSSVYSALRFRWLKNQLHPKPLIGQLAGTLRQRHESSTCKALIMAHPTDSGITVISISFMGTGLQIYDWISNLRVSSEDDSHAGFLQLTRQFESNHDAIHFPETAKSLKMGDLKLSDIIQSMRKPDSPFRIWLTGHSQGSAVLQLWCERRLRIDGVLPDHIQGYGFASPTVMTGKTVSDSASFPIFHVINSDDLVPRLGSRIHLGLLLIYHADHNLRSTCYTIPKNNKDLFAWQTVMSILDSAVGTLQTAELFSAILDVLTVVPPEELAGLFLHSGLLTVAEDRRFRRLFAAADAQADRILRYFQRRVRSACVSMCGTEPRQTNVNSYCSEIRKTIGLVGLNAFLTSLKDILLSAHRCNSGNSSIRSAYEYIAMKGKANLFPAWWRSGNNPHMISSNQPLVLLLNQPGIHHRSSRIRMDRVGRRPHTRYRREAFQKLLKSFKTLPRREV